MHLVWEKKRMLSAESKVLQLVFCSDHILSHLFKRTRIVWKRTKKEFYLSSSSLFCHINLIKIFFRKEAIFWTRRTWIKTGVGLEPLGCLKTVEMSIVACSCRSIWPGDGAMVGDFASILRRHGFSSFYFQLFLIYLLFEFLQCQRTQRFGGWCETWGYL